MLEGELSRAETLAQSLVRIRPCMDCHVHDAIVFAKYQHLNVFVFEATADGQEDWRDEIDTWVNAAWLRVLIRDREVVNNYPFRGKNSFKTINSFP